ncbi:MAG: GNAT family N-acetyltransferase [Deltaproteobacteria bacterium]|nr:GNAT family N-acetyltransferase [Deltaproteobacteria bacterium]
MINPLPPAEIEPAHPDDLGVIDRLQQEAFNTPWTTELLRAAILNEEYCVRVLRNPLLGLLGFYISHAVEKRCNLDNLVVRPAQRRKGLGTMLINDWAEQAAAKGLHVLTLQVNTANRDAQRLYERLGFRSTRILISYYPNGNDAFQMERGKKQALDDTLLGSLTGESPLDKLALRPLGLISPLRRKKQTP